MIAGKKKIKNKNKTIQEVECYTHTHILYIKYLLRLTLEAHKHYITAHAQANQ